MIGARSVVGRGSTIDNDVTIGERVLIQTLVYVTGGSVVEDDVFLGPGVITTNDDAMGRHPPGEPLLGVTLRRACRIGGGVVLTPGVEIGEEAFVAAGAVVTRDVGAREVVMGVPARVVRRVADEDLIERYLDVYAAGRRRSYSAASVQITCSRPGPTPTSAIGTPTNSEMKCR